MILRHADLQRHAKVCVSCTSYIEGASIAQPCTCMLADASATEAAASRSGGGEYGIAWREAGSCANKQNVFDDFIACAEFLQAEGYTSPGKLVIQACLVQAVQAALLSAECTPSKLSCSH